MNYQHPGGFLLFISIMTIVVALGSLFLGVWQYAAIMVPLAGCHVALLLGQRWAAQTLLVIYAMALVVFLARLIIEGVGGHFNWKMASKLAMNGCVAGALYGWLKEN